VIEAEDFGDFKRAIKEKLWREFTSFVADSSPPAGGYRVAGSAIQN